MRGVRTRHHRLRGAWASVLLVVLGGLITAATAQARPRAVPHGFIGMMADGPIFDRGVNLGAQLGQMASSGVQSVRVAFDWNLAQPYADWGHVPIVRRANFTGAPGGVPTDFRATDTIVRLSALHHLPLLPVVVSAPSWDASPRGYHIQPVRDAPFGRYLSALVHRYGPRGSFWSANPSIPRQPIGRWQVWNEPDGRYFWDTAHFALGYVALLRVAHAAIKRADPNAKVVLGALTANGWRDLKAIYRVHGARRLFDAVASNTYASAPAGVIALLAHIRRLMVRYGDRAKPLLDTEVGWPSAAGQGTTTFGIETTERGQATKLKALVPLLATNRRRLGLGGFYYYTWLSTDQRGAFSPFMFSGLFRYDALTHRIFAKPAFAAFRQTALALERGR